MSRFFSSVSNFHKLKFRTFSPVKVAMTGGSGSVGDNLAFRIAMGDMLGINQPVQLALYGRSIERLQGIKFELEDTCGPLLDSVIISDSYEEVFGDADVACLVGVPPRKDGMDRSDLLHVSGEVLKIEGQMLGKVAKKTCKVIVVGNPANTNALVASANCDGVPPENFTAMTRLDHNRALFQLSQAIKKTPQDIEGLVIWGNHSNMMYPDIAHCTVNGEGIQHHLDINQYDDKWITETFIPRVQNRGREIIQARGSSSAPSAALACVDQVRDWVIGSDNKITSMAILSGVNSQYNIGSYGVESGLFFSYPVVCDAGSWTLVDSLSLNEFAYHMLQKNVDELKVERDAVRHLLP